MEAKNTYLGGQVVDTQFLQNVCNVIILLGAVAGAIAGIMALIGKPIVFFKKRREKAEKERCKEIVEDVSALVEKKIVPRLDEIHQQNLEQSQDIETLTHTMRNSIGAEIMAFYEAHRSDRTLTESEKDAIEDLYKSYKTVNGNHYVDKVYDRMTHWTVTDEDGKEVKNVTWQKPLKEDK